jgi:hypothetical protein
VRNRTTNDELRLGRSQFNAAMKCEDWLRRGGGGAQGNRDERKGF